MILGRPNGPMVLPANGWPVGPKGAYAWDHHPQGDALGWANRGPVGAAKQSFWAGGGGGEFVSFAVGGEASDLSHLPDVEARP